MMMMLIFVHKMITWISFFILGGFLHGMKVLEFLNALYSWKWNLELLGYCFIFFLLIVGINNL